MNLLDTLGMVAAVLLMAIGGVAVWLQVPPLPSRRQEAEAVFALAKIQPGEVVFDLGAGDGRLLQQARDEFKARISGWELSPLIWLLAKMRLGRKSDVRLANLWTAPVGEADVVFVFLMDSLMGRVREQIWSKMKPGARLVSNSFPMVGVEPSMVLRGVFMYEKRSIG